VGKMAGTEVATARVTGVVSQIWAANPELSYRQAIDILKQTATDLGVPGWDVQTGSGLVNLAAAISLARMTVGEGKLDPEAITGSVTWSGDSGAVPTERAAFMAQSSVESSPLPETVSRNVRTGTVVSSVGVNVRPTASTAQAAITRLSNGATVQVLRSVTGGSYDNGRTDWFEVSVNGRIGYIAGAYLSVGSASTPPPASPTSSTGFSTVINQATGRALDSGGPNNSVYPHSSPTASNPYHQWRFERVGNDYMIIDRATGRALDAGGAGNTRAYMHPSPNRNNPWHLWQVIPVGSSYMLVSRATGRALDAGGAGNAEIYMHERPTTGNPWHLWRLNLSQATQTTPQQPTSTSALTQLLNGQLTNRYFDVDGRYGAQCWDLVAHVTGQRGSTTNWKRGASVMSGGIPVGTPIATFLGANGSYDTPGAANQHTGIFAGYGAENGVSGFYIWHQNWPTGSPVQRYFMRASGSGVYNAHNYRVIQF